MLKGLSYSCFAGNDYPGLAAHPETTKAAAAALQQYGVNFSASRKTTGTSGIHLELERLPAEFKGQEDAIVFASGYMGNRLLPENLKERMASRKLFVLHCSNHSRRSLPGSRLVFSRSDPFDPFEYLAEMVPVFETAQLKCFNDGIFPEERF